MKHIIVLLLILTTVFCYQSFGQDTKEAFLDPFSGLVSHAIQLTPDVVLHYSGAKVPRIMGSENRELCNG